ncbi:MAG: discoidin domain-containing protein [Verrucomicrobiota bacterium]
MNPLLRFTLLSATAILSCTALAFEKPVLAPEYIPPVATGDPVVNVGAEGADLSGTWTIKLDNEKKPTGETDEWFNSKGFENKIDLPNALQNAGFGNPVTAETRWIGGSGINIWMTDKYKKYRQPGNVKVPFFLQPEKRFIGQAWYHKTIVIEQDAPKDKELILRLERPHWSTKVWLDGKLIGFNNSLGLPHEYELGSNLKTGKYELIIQVDNDMILPVGDKAHSVSDETQGAWNGIIGDMALEWRNPVYIDQIKVFTDYRTKSADVKLWIENRSGSTQNIRITLQGKTSPHQLAEGNQLIESKIEFGADAALWNEFTPALHEVNLSLDSDWGQEEKKLRVGIRNLETEGLKFIFNGHETFMRGTLDCAIFPLTGYPPMDNAAWLKHFGAMKASGINHVRFHSWCPPRAAFEAGDELGMYLMPEIHIWGDPAHPDFDGWVEAEGKRIIDEYGNHPSFAFFTHGNEPWRTGKNEPFLAELTKTLKAYDSRMLHTASANTIQSEYDEFTCTAQPRGPYGWKGRGFSHKHKTPFIQHEPGQWCVYPNFDEMVKYTGPLKPKNFEIFMEQAEATGVLPQWRDFLRASGMLQMLCYKEDCEAALASDGIAGTQLLQISDFSGQGTSLVGYLDAFMDEKGYFTKKQFSRFWNPSVPLARMSSYIYENSDELNIPILYAYFGHQPLKQQTLLWEISDSDGKVHLDGEFDDLEINAGRNAVGNLTASLKPLPAPARYTLTLKLAGTNIFNHWDFFVCEGDPDTTFNEVAIHHFVDDALKADLAAGKSVLFMPREHSLAHPKLSFQPVYWNRFHFSHSKDRSTLGLLIDNDHPALKGFPSKFHTTWSWEPILAPAYGLVMDKLPQTDMIIQPIDDWNDNRLLGFLMEYRVGRGKLLICMSDLTQIQDKQPAARQLLSSLLDYMQSSEFTPTIGATLEDLSDDLRYSSNKSMLNNLGATVKDVSHQWKRSGKFAIDGDPGTNWAGAFKAGSGHITIDLGKETQLQGIQLSNTNLKTFTVSLGNDLNQLQQVDLLDAKKGIRTLDQADSQSDQKIGFKQKESGRYLRIDITGIYGNSIRFGEMDVIFILF